MSDDWFTPVTVERPGSPPEPARIPKWIPQEPEDLEFESDTEADR